jgi:hypothetical protein
VEESLSQLLSFVVFAGFTGLAVAQTPNFPPDIDPVSMSRFPIVERSAMKTDAERAAYDYVGTAPRWRCVDWRNILPWLR